MNSREQQQQIFDQIIMIQIQQQSNSTFIYRRENRPRSDFHQIVEEKTNSNLDF